MYDLSKEHTALYKSNILAYYRLFFLNRINTTGLFVEWSVNRYNVIENDEANNLIVSKTVKYILLTSSNLPARLLSAEGAIEIVPPDFKTINSNGAGDATAAYIAAFGVNDLIPNIKKACAAGAIVAGTNDKPTVEKIEEISQLVDVNPR